jgi:HipA-like protein
MAYSLGIFLRERQVGTLNQDKNSGQLKITYLDAWQRNGYAISTGLTLNNQHTLSSEECLYNDGLLDNIKTRTTYLKVKLSIFLQYNARK